MAITTKDGLLYRDGEMIPLPEADKVARMHGFAYAEQLVRDLEAKAAPQPDWFTKPTPPSTHE